MEPFVSRYFFHIHDGSDYIDQDGVELSGLDEAREQAVVAAGEALKDLDGKFWTNADWRLWVTDEAGATVCSLRLLAE